MHSPQYLALMAQFAKNRAVFKQTTTAYQDTALGAETVEAMLTLIEFAVEAGLFNDEAILSRDESKRLIAFYANRIKGV